jgi:hypothetical protein
MMSPHFHVLGFGWIQDTAEIYNSKGWIVKNLGVRKSVYWTFQYILSHAGVFLDPESSFHPVKFHVATWFGELSYNSMETIPKLITFKEYCPHCGLLLMPMDDDELKRFPPPETWDSEDFLVETPFTYHI